MFWRHKEPEPAEMPSELGLGREHDTALGFEEQDFGPTTGLAPPGAPPAPPGAQAFPPSMQPSSFPQPSSIDKDIQLLSAKLDSLKAILDNMSQRLANIERIAQEAQQAERQDIYERY